MDPENSEHSELSAEEHSSGEESTSSPDEESTENGDANQNESTEEADDSEDEEEEEEEEEEPQLKYQRLQGNIVDLLKKEPASALAVSDKFLVLGTHWGIVYLLDLEGTQTKRIPCHAASVTDVCIDAAGEYIASASDDGKVIIHGLYTGESTTYTYKRPVKAIALDPEFAKRGARQFCTGGMAEQLVFHEKGWFGYRDTVIHEGEGPIYTIKWNGSIVAWANDIGVKLYDIQNSIRISHIERTPDSPRADLYKCHLSWKNSSTLLIGWANKIQMTVIKETPRSDFTTTFTPTKRGEIIFNLQTEYIVSGIVPYGDMLVVLAYFEDHIYRDDQSVAESLNSSVSGEKKPARRPEVRLLHPLYEDPELSSDGLNLQGYENFQAKDYKLVHNLTVTTSEEPQFFILSPRDIVLAKARDTNDHISWLLSKNKYEDAFLVSLDASKKNIEVTESHSVKEVGQKLLEWLIQNGEFERAAGFCNRILARDIELWEKWIQIFAKHNQLEIITPCIPTENPILNPATYETVLLHYLDKNPPSFFKLISKWPAEIYQVHNLVANMESKLEKDPQNKTILQSSAILYTHANQPVKSLHCYIKLRDVQSIFNLLSSSASILAQFVQNQALEWFELMEYMVKKKVVIELKETEKKNWDRNWSLLLTNQFGELLDKGKKGQSEGTRNLVRECTSSVAMKMLIKDLDLIPIPTIIAQLTPHPRYLHIYLDSIFYKDIHISSSYHYLQVELYPEYDPSRFLNFLKSSVYYPLELALKVCQERELIHEWVYVLGRMGNNKEALNVIMSKLGDIKMAIEFAKEQNDEELWDDIIQYSLDKPAFITALLENVGTHIDLIKLISRIPNNLTIPNLKSSLIRIMRDYHVQLSLRKGCEKIIVGDMIGLLDRLFGMKKKGVCCDVTMLCLLCGNPIIEEAPTNSTSLNSTILFNCQHIFHSSCVLSPPPPPAQSSLTGSTPKSHQRSESPVSLNPESDKTKDSDAQSVKSEKSSRIRRLRKDSNSSVHKNRGSGRNGGGNGDDGVEDLADLAGKYELYNASLYKKKLVCPLCRI
ncbi:hypothetical protein BKA69DRAFT_1127186 [Paraphysoderma sedebokerense]|nr:hypothetical protein BKA69DRAFT_1127186 [Paraphysoderma sedebokerense]